MPFLGELRVVECHLRRFEIGTAVLLVGIEEEGIEPPVQIVMTRNIVFGTAAWVELLGMPDQITQAPLQLGPARQYLGLIQQNRQRVRDRAVLDNKSAVHVGLAQTQFRIQQDVAFGIDCQAADQDRNAGSVTANDPCAVSGNECHRSAPDELFQKRTQYAIHRNYLLQMAASEIRSNSCSALSRACSSLDISTYWLLLGIL